MFRTFNANNDTPETALSDIISCILICMIMVTAVMVVPQQQRDSGQGGDREEAVPPLPPPPPIPEPVPEPVPEPEPKPTPKPPRIGFTLGFESDAALIGLTALGTINVYSITGDQRLHWNYKAGWQPNFEEKMPAQYYELKKVPDELQRTASRSSKGQPEFGITLPAQMLNQINQYITEHTGGDLMILTNGTVQFSP